MDICIAKSDFFIEKLIGIEIVKVREKVLMKVISETAKEFIEHFYEDKFPYLSRSRGVRTSPLVS